MEVVCKQTYGAFSEVKWDEVRWDGMGWFHLAYVTQQATCSD